jgi:hypothetical protein
MTRICSRTNRPFVNAHTNWTDIQDGLDLLWRNDIDPKKVILGTSFYTRAFQLSDPGCGEPKCGVVSAGNPGKCSNTAGVLLHAEVQDIIKEKKLTPKSYRTEMVKTIHWDNQWTSFDDEQTWRLKLNTARGQCISGIMVWAISQDDTSSTNSMALTRAAGRTVMNMPNFNEQPALAAPLQAIQTCNVLMVSRQYLGMERRTRSSKTQRLAVEPKLLFAALLHSPCQSVHGADIRRPATATLVAAMAKWKWGHKW